MANAALFLLPAKVKPMHSSDAKSQVSSRGEGKRTAVGPQANG